MSRTLAQDHARLHALNYRRFERCGLVVRDLHRLRRRIDRDSLAPQIWRVYHWLMCPLTLWALDYAGIAEYIVRELRARRDFDQDFVLLLLLIDQPPRALIQDRMQAHEQDVAAGRYERLSRGPERFDEIAAACQSDPDLHKFWGRLKQRYNGVMRPNSRGVVRRTLARERNFDPRVEFDWRTRVDRFQISFDALCYRWCLYGFEKDEPLALKLTANATPHGTMILIPRRMSLDGPRAIVWRAINQVHRVHAAPKQGAKLYLIRVQARKDRVQARQCDKEARAACMKGDNRYIYILRKMRQPINRISWVRRLLARVP